MSTAKVKVALIGYGVVGQGFASLASERADIEIVAVCVNNKAKPRIGNQHFVFNVDDLFELDFDVVVEATDAPYKKVKEWYLSAQDIQVPFVTANKQFVATYLASNEISEDDRGLLYEASVSAAIPIIRSLQTCFPQGVKRIEGILNGSSNYILSDIFRNGSSIEEAIQIAQLKGFAESDPSLDLNGSDPAAKLAILIRNAFGIEVGAKEIPVFGLESINGADIRLARSLGNEIRYIAHAEVQDGKLTARVAPVLVEKESLWGSIQEAENAIVVTDASDESYLFKGRGAGARPTGTALLNDVLASQSGFRYRYADDVKRLPIQDVRRTVWIRSYKDKAIIDPLRSDVISSRLDGPWDHNQFRTSLKELIEDTIGIEKDHGVLFTAL
ncbi:MAG: homoserine dehydrogenase [Flavobacteriales bacterium]|nr:homoserine dehydrogenase [Flavobacteriales bacterium]